MRPLSGHLTNVINFRRFGRDMPRFVA